MNRYHDTRCAYCPKIAVHVWRYRSRLASRRTQITAYVRACADHKQSGEIAIANKAHVSRVR